MLTDYDAYPIVANDWYRIVVVWNSNKMGGIPCDILVDDQGTDGLGSGENWIGLANCTDSDQSQLTDDRKLYEGDTILSADGSIHIGATANHTLPFNGLIDWINVEAAVNGEPTVPVLITAFVAKATDAGIELTWDVVSDENIKGCRIYRRDKANGANRQVNSEGLLSPEEGSFQDVVVDAGQTYWYMLGVVNEDGIETLSRTVTATVKTTSITLRQNYPNPFNPATTISFVLAERVRVNLSIYDIEGKLVRVIVDEMYEAGLREVVWDGVDSEGNPASSGIYFYRLTAGQNVLTKKMVLIK